MASYSDTASIFSAAAGLRVGGYAEHRARDAATAAIEAAWRHHASLDDAAALAHRVLPEPGVSLVCVGRRRADGRLDDAQLVFHGPVRTPRWYRPAPGDEMIAVRVAPEAAGALFGVDAASCGDAVEDADDLLGDWGARLRDALASAPDERARLARLFAAARSRAAQTQATPDPIAARAAALLRRTHGATRMRDLAAHLEVSERHLRRRLRDAVGLGPKSYARHLRLMHAVARADAETRPRWAAIAADAGYVDQAHLVAETRALAGASPAALHRERRAQPLV